MNDASGTGGGVNATHETENGQDVSGPVRSGHETFEHSMLRRCFNHDYRDPFFYMVTVTTHERRPWFGVCRDNACVLNADGWLVHNRFLLDRPEKRAVRVSRSAAAHEIEALREEVLEVAAQGTVIVSPFISPGEREMATAILAAPVGDVILIKPGGFAPLFKPNGRYFDLCVQGRQPVIVVLARRLYDRMPVAWNAALNDGRLLIISTSPAARASKSTTRLRNRYIIDHADHMVLGSLTPGGSLASLLSSLPPSRVTLL